MQLERLAHKAKSDHKAHRESKAKPVPQAIQVRRESKASKATPETQVLRVLSV